MMNNQKGLSLVELMISIVIGLILLTGVTRVFLNSKATYSTQQALSRVQETGRLAIEFLSHDIRMAGYTGCGSRASIPITNTLNSPTAFSYDYGNGIIGYTAASVPSGLSPTPITSPSTDVISIRGASGSGIKVIQNNNGAQLFASVDSVETNGCGTTDRISGLCENDIVMVTDCTKATVFQISNLTTTGSGAGAQLNVVHSGSGTPTPGNAVTSWGGSSVSDTFGPGAEIMMATNTTYFIATGTSGRPSLYQRVNGGTSTELLEGVENLSVTYGVDLLPAGVPDFVPESYETATTINSTPANWANVRSVRIEVLVASIEDNVLPEKQKYKFPLSAATLTTPSDRRLRQVFTTTIGIRSRLH
ncbi:PilW family protein [Cellvibrio sp.]|uniref:PilW family protein n=1 Tax=Cellvibrio sp. TaxID=1965322 RepID=UPI0039647947